MMNFLRRSNFSTGAIRSGLFCKIPPTSPNLSGSSPTPSFQLRSIVLSSHQFMEVNSEQIPHGLFVQTLPVIINPSSSSQSINSETERKILLCKWASGDFKDRYTGLIRRISGDQFQHIYHQRHNLQKEKLLRQIALELLPPSLRPFVSTELDLVGKLRFADPPIYDEFVYIAHLTLPSQTLPDMKGGDADKSTIDFQEIIRFDEHPCFWFNWEEIPFPQMPADDELWYPKVLWEGKKVKGCFTFGGWSEKALKSFELFTVDAF